MKAVMLTGAGGTENLKLMEVPDPVLAGPQDTLIRLHAAGLNPVDYKLRRVGGFYPNRMPLILGCDGAGVIEAVGDKVTKFQVGDEVYFFNGGMGGDDQGNPGPASGRDRRLLLLLGDEPYDIFIQA